MKIAFSGHSVIPPNHNLKDLVKKQIQNHITAVEPIACYLGGYGDFDTICARACKELKDEYLNMQLIYVTPYLHLSEQVKMKNMQIEGFFDTIIYPPIEHVPLKFAILKRNEWMMTNADLIIAYVNHGYGGAYQALQIAKRKKKKIINICDLIKDV